mgnify:CR=1 FL=1
MINYFRELLTSIGQHDMITTVIGETHPIANSKLIHGGHFVFVVNGAIGIEGILLDGTWILKEKHQKLLIIF